MTRLSLRRLLRAALYLCDVRRLTRERHDALYALGREVVAHAAVRASWSTLHADVVRLTAERDAARAEAERLSAEVRRMRGAG